MTTRDDEPDGSASGSGGDRTGNAERPSARLGPIGRDRVHDGENYYANDAEAAPGDDVAPAADGAGGSMGGGLATTVPATTDAQTALGEPAGGARGHIAGDSQGGRIDDGSAPDSQATPSPGAPT